MNKRYFKLRRILAGLLDLLIIVAIFSLFCLYPLYIFFNELNAGVFNPFLLILNIILFALFLVISSLLFALSLYSRWKTTFGMRFFDLHISSLNQKNVTFHRLFLRELFVIFILFLTGGICLLTYMLTILVSDSGNTYVDVLSFLKVEDNR